MQNMGICAALTAAVIGGSATAQDVVIYDATTPVAAPVAVQTVPAGPQLVEPWLLSDWGGAYGMLRLGQQSLDQKTAGTVTDSGRPKTVGVSFGYLVDSGQWVSGVEMNAMRYQPFTAKSNQRYDGNEFSAKAIVGYDMIQALPYVTLGTVRSSFNGGADNPSGSGTLYGVGVRYKVQEKLLVGAEITYRNYSKWNGTNKSLSGKDVALSVGYRF